MVRFRVETIPLEGELDVQKEKSFLNSAIDFFRSIGADMVIPATTNTIFRTYPDDEDLLEDVITENQQAIEMTNIASNILSSMMDAFASIISNNMNVVIKFLTAVTIVLTLPTVITSFYGMNVRMPLQDWPFASWLILGVSLIAGVAVVFFFLKRDWM